MFIGRIWTRNSPCATFSLIVNGFQCTLKAEMKQANAFHAFLETPCTSYLKQLHSKIIFLTAYADSNSMHC